ncbi:MAG: 30S ribosomal protein S4 [Actinomycetota bacterium]
MARYTEAVCRLCRREKVKLFLKGARCESAQCAMERRPYPPGDHGGGRRTKESQYLLQLREKQKCRRIYGVLERQFRGYYREAARRKGVTGETLLQILESRLDNIVYRAGLARSRNQARQLVLHQHILVNGKRVNVPSYLTKPGDTVQVKESSREIAPVQLALQAASGRTAPAWLEITLHEAKATIRDYPTRSHIEVPVQEQLIVELYSR